MTDARTDMVCLCSRFDLKRFFGAAFDQHTDIRLLAPDEVDDPARIRFSLAFAPGPDQFDRYPNLELVCCGGAGVDRLVSHPGLRDTMTVVRMINPIQPKMMAGYVIHHVVGWHRRMGEYPELQAQRRWTPLDLSDPSTFPVGVLGYGEIGEGVGTGLTACGYPVTGWASRPRRVNEVEVLAGADGLDRILSESRALVCALPLTAATHGILNRDAFAKMRDDALLIQVGRGAHLVEHDLIEALDAGRPALAVLDVTDPEPPAEDSPLWAHPKVRLTPHMSSFNSPEAVARGVAASVHAHLSGQRPIGAVDRGRGY